MAQARLPDVGDPAAVRRYTKTTFLAAVREAADEWELLEPADIGVRYADLVNEAGIRLP